MNLRGREFYSNTKALHIPNPSLQQGQDLDFFFQWLEPSQDLSEYYNSFSENRMYICFRMEYNQIVKRYKQ